MSTSAAQAMESIVERVRERAGGEFAFVLTMRGRLVSARAPKDMPTEGRLKLVDEARRVGSAVGIVTLPRQELVPYGGAAPIDVYVGLALGQAVVCVVMATWADKARVPAAVAEGVRAIEPMLRPSKSSPARKKIVSTVRPVSPRAEEQIVARASGDTSTRALAPAPIKPASGLSALASAAPKPKLALSRPRGSLPSIRVEPAELGRETMIAIEADVERAIAPPRGSPSSSMPDVRVELTSIGRVTELDLRSEEAARMQSMINAKRIAPAVAPKLPRLTQPWVEPAVDTMRAVKAASSARKHAAPNVTLKLEDLDEDLTVAEADERPTPPSAPSPSGPRKSIDVWHEAIEQATPLKR